jgi:hypothetical protein
LNPVDLEQILARQPIELLKRLASKYCSPAALRDRSLAERDAAYRGLAAGSIGTSGYAIQGAVRAFVERYRDRGAWRFDRGRAPPADPRRALAHQILTLDGGRVRSRSTVERALAGVRSNSPPQMNGHLPDAPCEMQGSMPCARSGQDEGCTTAEGLRRAAGGR